MHRREPLGVFTGLTNLYDSSNWASPTCAEGSSNLLRRPIDSPPSAFEFVPREQEQIWSDEVSRPLIPAGALSVRLPRHPVGACSLSDEESDHAA